MECSSKENIGVEDIFDTAITMAVGDEEDRELGGAGGGRGSGLSKGSSGERRRKKKGGCKFL
jgi:Ras family protein A